MILLKNLKFPLDTDFNNLIGETAKILMINEKSITKTKLYKKSIDARDKDNIFFCCSVLIDGNKPAIIKHAKKYSPQDFFEKPIIWHKPKILPKHRPIIIGFGPAGIFAAYTLAKAGLNPLVLERGKDCDSRKKDVEAFHKTGILNPDSNVQFGEGGAGTFSDGKLNSGIKSEYFRTVLKTFHMFGADEDILYDAKPHIGTDVLINVIKNMRKEIIALGGEIRFCNKVTDIIIKNQQIASVEVVSPDKTYFEECDSLILAIGHSSRDTFEMLHRNNVNIEPKAFSIGARIEHPQTLINQGRFGKFCNNTALGSADYKFAQHLENGRSVYTFCMCPGGYVINASSEPGCVVTNGMSYKRRDGKNANSALLVNITPEDFYHGSVLDGVYFQQKIEKKAFVLSQGKGICQTVGDFLNKTTFQKGISPTISPSPVYGCLDDILPDYVTDSLRTGIKLFNDKLPGFSNPDAILTGPETRSSSPIKILRSTSFMSQISGLYPCGEGAGYAGGIMSSAVDGIKVAQQIIKSLAN
ncbi:MAG: hypothetical protein Q4B04_05340 [bacterium]|nr:hypothetical protein [bacterium]